MSLTLSLGDCDEPMPPITESREKHSVVADDGRRYGVRLAERMIEHYGLRVDLAEAEEAAAHAKCEILECVREFWTGGMPGPLAILWGHEAVNGLTDRILEHVEYLRVAALLVGVDPATAMSEQPGQRM
jgi:hypothetical protein